MLITQRGGRRRALASLLTGALVAGLTFAGAAPAGAVSDPVTVSGGSATWNFTDGWTSYITGSIAQGTVTPALVGGKSVYQPASGSYDASTGEGTISFGGSTTYAGHHGALDLTISDLRLRLASATTGVLTADFGGAAATGPGNDVAVADVTIAPTRNGDKLTLVANGKIAEGLKNVSSYFADYAGKPMSTLTATFDAPVPVAPATATTTTLAASPAGTSIEGVAVVLSATVAPSAAGSVEFFDGAAPLGTVPVSDGVARHSVATPAVGAHSFTARFTPTDTAAFSASTSAAVVHTVTAEQVDPPAPVADPKVTVTPSTDVDPAVENTFQVSGTGFVGAGARYGAYVLIGETSVWSGGSALPGAGWLKQVFVPTSQVKDGAFTTQIVIPAGTLDATTTYQVATSAAHGLSMTDRTLDTFTPITVKGAEPPAPVFVPEVEVFAADGKSALGSTVVRPGDEVVVKGTGFDPASNVGGRGMPIPKHLPQGTYVVFGSFAKEWQPSKGVPSSARKVGAQVWALAGSVLDQVPPAFQESVRKQWVDLSADGSFTARLTLGELEAIEGGSFGVYTYAAGGVNNAAQEIGVPVNFTNAPAPAPLTVTPGASSVTAGEKLTLTVSGLGADDKVASVLLGGAPATFTTYNGVSTVTVPADLAPGQLTVKVVSELGASGQTAVEVVGKPAAMQVGSLRWGVKESFRSYITGNIAQGGAVASDGATVVDGLFGFGQVKGGTWKPGSTTGSVDYDGKIAFSGHGGLLNLTLANPSVVVGQDGTGTLVVDVRSANLDGTTFAAAEVPFASLVLGKATVLSDGAVSYRDAAATLTAEGSQAFSDFYPAGEALDPLTFVMGAGAAPTDGGNGNGGTIGNPGTGTKPLDPTQATLSTYQVVPGGQVTISGVGFGANETGLTSIIRSTPRTLATGITANAGGAASATVTIPTDLEPGEHTLSLEGAHHKVSAAITVTGPATPVGTPGATAATQCFAQGVNGATLTWGVSDSFRAYIAGPIAKGSVSTSGVKDNGSSFTWGGGKGSFNTELGKGRTGFGGSVQFTGHAGILDLKISNPRVQVDGSTGTLVVDVVSSDMEGNKSTSNGVAFASLNLAGKKSTSGSTVTWTGASATLTASGAKAFAGFYDAGTPLAPVTFSFPIGGDVECDAYSGLANTGADASTLAALAVMFVLGGAGILVASNRRRARADA